MFRQKLKHKDLKKTLEQGPYYHDKQTWKLDAGPNVPAPNTIKI